MLLSGIQADDWHIRLIVHWIPATPSAPPPLRGGQGESTREGRIPQDYRECA
jgi:hypothetical protein